jgi:hypothetical protein
MAGLLVSPWAIARLTVVVMVDQGLSRRLLRRQRSMTRARARCPYQGTLKIRTRQYGRTSHA